MIYYKNLFIAIFLLFGLHLILANQEVDREAIYEQANAEIENNLKEEAMTGPMLNRFNKKKTTPL